MLQLAAYADRLSARPGETIRFHVANATSAPVTARLVRVVCADPNPAGPGVQLESVPHVPRALATAKPEQVRQGSYAVVEAPDLGLPAVVTLSADVFPTRLAGRRQGVMSLAMTGGLRLDLAIAEEGAVEASVVLPGGTAHTVRAANPVDEHRWYRVRATLDGDRLAVRRAEHGDRTRGSSEAGNTAAIPVTRIESVERGAWIIIGATAGREPETAFDGRIEHVQVHDDSAAGPRPATLIAHWDFAREQSGQRILDVGPNGWHGLLVNTPTRAVTGATWTGREMCWRHAPDEYAAIHFHSDDLDDCRWPATHEWTVPADLRSGNYALMLEAGDAHENVPFFVVPARGVATARLAVLVSTFTYTIYGNHARPEWSADAAWKAAWKRQAAEWPGAYRANPGDHAEYGLSTYNYHRDGSGIAHASWHRPMLNVRIGYITYPYPEIRGSGLRHYPADTHLTAWLESKGIAYDIVTDAELHHEGAALLAPYACVLTGTHPEYHTRAMLDALTNYRDGGGRLGYLGGNGFYWKIALDPERPGRIEIRRGEGGIRAWAADPGEYYNQFDGEYGGLWRRNGRPPQHLTGIGFTAQGNFLGSYYRRTPEAADTRVAWMFDGVAGDIIGDYGLSGHGAAGFELDRTDKRLGTPAGAIVVARSENHPPDAPWVLVPEEQLTHLTTTVPGVPARDLIHADMTFFTTAGGRGAVFSTGSITFCGSLPAKGFLNPVSRLLENVVRRFVDPTPFAG